MPEFIAITPQFAITSALGPEDFARAAAAGFRTIINNRPDGEEPAQLAAATAAQHAANNGLRYSHVPATKHDLLTDPVVARMAAALAAGDGPILAHCKSGQRSAIVWAAAAARQRPVAEVLQSLRDAGLDLGFLRDELDKQADRACWSEVEPIADRRAAAAA